MITISDVCAVCDSECDRRMGIQCHEIVGTRRIAFTDEYFGTGNVGTECVVRRREVGTIVVTVGTLPERTGVLRVCGGSAKKVRGET